jgi:DNA-binding NarL/FixJ family response regulator
MAAGARSADTFETMPRVYLCDDAPDYRLLMREVLSTEDDIEIVGEGCNGEECVTQAPDLAPDVILLDVNMPRLNGLQALPQLREIMPDTEVLVLSSAEAGDIEERALRMGATGYLQKPMNVFGLAGAMRGKLRALDRRSSPRT